MPTKKDHPAKFLTLRQAASVLSCSTVTMYRLCAEGKIPHRRLGVRYLFRLDELVAWWYTLPGTPIAASIDAVGKSVAASKRNRDEMAHKTQQETLEDFRQQMAEIVLGKEIP
jgi:excisionase family DNA binding protein